MSLSERVASHVWNSSGQLGDSRYTTPNEVRICRLLSPAQQIRGGFIRRTDCRKDNFQFSGFRSVVPAAGLIFGMVARATNQDADVSLDDARIVQRIAGGDSAALGELYDRWSDAVYAAAFAIVGVAEDAEEVVEDTFWQAWKQASRFEIARGAVRSWLLTIARSRAMDKRKSVSRRREEQLESAPPDLLVNDARTDDRLVEGERTTMVANALSDLPPVQREVLEMAYFGGLSQSEIADCTGLAIGTIKTRIRLGMMKLREQLAPSRQTTT